MGSNKSRFLLVQVVVVVVVIEFLDGVLKRFIRSIVRSSCQPLFDATLAGLRSRESSALVSRSLKVVSLHRHIRPTPPYRPLGIIVSGYLC